MIDAYEIGIELALQDGISAGLDAIAKEMAALDAAVAGSSARLVTLTRTAQTAAATVAAVGGVRAKVVEPQAADTATPVEQKQETAPGAATLDVAAAPAAAGERVVQEAVAGETQATSAAASEPAREAVRPADMPSAAPIAGQNAEQARGEPDTRQTAMRPFVVAAPQVAAPAVAPIERPVTASAPRGAAVTEARPRDVVADLIGAGRGSDAPARIIPALDFGEVRADVASVTPFKPVTPDVPPRERQDEAAVRDMPSRPAYVPVERGQASSAPMAGLFAESAAAPQGESDGRDDGGGGTVVLDGRLVGHWLSERMARDAARPAAGATFFDSRQTPAWTPSGVL